MPTSTIKYYIRKLSKAQVIKREVRALSLILCKHQKVQKTKMYFREVVYRPLDCILAEDGAFVKGGAAVHLDP